MLKIENVTKYYGDFKAVDNLSFVVEPGEIFGLLGVNGAGKTTTFRMIMGLLEPTEGTITLDGKPIDYSVTDHIGFLTEERSLLTKLTVLEQCEFYGTLKGMSNEKIHERLNYLLEKFGVLEYKNKKIKELSKGNQQKIQFITAILNEPKLLILDEPFVGLDPKAAVVLKQSMGEICKEGGAIFFSTHVLEVAEKLCDRIAIIKEGKLVVSGETKEVTQNESLEEVFLELVSEDA